MSALAGVCLFLWRAVLFWCALRLAFICRGRDSRWCAGIGLDMACSRQKQERSALLYVSIFVALSDAWGGRVLLLLISLE